MKLSERVQFDDDQNIATIDGYRVSGVVFSEFTTVTPLGRWFRIISCDDGVITIETKVDK